MSDGMKAWADDEHEEYYKTNHIKDTKEFEDYLKSPEFRRLVELRIKYKELRELQALEYQATRKNEMYSNVRTVSFDKLQLLREGL